jgi:hypothetical protein
MLLYIVCTFLKRLPGVGSEPGSSRFSLFSHFNHFPLSHSGSPYCMYIVCMLKKMYVKVLCKFKNLQFFILSKKFTFLSQNFRYECLLPTNVFVQKTQHSFPNRNSTSVSESSELRSSAKKVGSTTKNHATRYLNRFLWHCIR